VKRGTCPSSTFRSDYRRFFFFLGGFGGGFAAETSAGVAATGVGISF
jgi:hypothetical protein